MHQREGVGPRRNAPWSERACECHKASQDDLHDEEATDPWRERTERSEQEWILQRRPREAQSTKPRISDGDHAKEQRTDNGAERGGDGAETFSAEEGEEDDGEVVDDRPNRRGEEALVRGAPDTRHRNDSKAER